MSRDAAGYHASRLATCWHTWTSSSKASHMLPYLELSLRGHQVTSRNISRLPPLRVHLVWLSCWTASPTAPSPPTVSDLATVPPPPLLFFTYAGAGTPPLIFFTHAGTHPHPSSSSSMHELVDIQERVDLVATAK
jgi:hypothetical protein